MRFHREIFTAQPSGGDYILRPTGFSWSVHRSDGHAAAHSISEGNADRKTALGKLLVLAEADQTDGWETVSSGVFRRVKQFRPDAGHHARVK